MRTWTNLVLMTSAMLAFTLPAMAEGHGTEPTPCETDADCADEYHVCVEGHAHDDEDAIAVSTDVVESCETDEECAEGGTCVDEMCIYASNSLPGEPSGDEEGSDEDAKFCVVDLDALPIDPACTALCDVMAGCGLGSVESVESVETSDSGGEASSAGFAPDEGEGSEDAGGDGDEEPSIDVPVESCDTSDDCSEEDAECIDTVCTTEWDHSEGDPPVSEPIELSPEELEQANAMCSQMCNYGAYLEAGIEELTALNACLDAAESETVCEDNPCEDEGQAWSAALEAAGVMANLEHAQGAVNMGAAEVSADELSEGLNAADDGSSSGTTSGEAAGNTDAGSSSSAATAKEDDGGCNASGAPFVPWVVLMSLMTLVLMRRRQTA